MKGHSIALWAGLTTLFANLAAVNVIALIGDESAKGVQAIAATITAILVAAGVYAKQRWDDAKRAADEPVDEEFADPE